MLNHVWRGRKWCPMTLDRDLIWYKKISLRFHSPAAKAWQVSRHTPTLVWSLTLSMMLFSSENLPPNVLPWPLMFSSTEHTGGGGKKEKDALIQPICYNTWYTCRIGLAAPFIPEAQSEGRFSQLLQCFCSLSTVVHSCHIGGIWGMQVKSTVVCAMNRK